MEEEKGWCVLLFQATHRLLAHLREQQDVLGVLLVGSKSRGYEDDRSDDDLEVILSPTTPHGASPSFEQHIEGEKLLYDVRSLSLTQLQQKVSSPNDSEHWPYTAARVLFDRSNLVQPVVEALSHMDRSFRHDRIVYSTMSTTITIGKACKAIQRNYQAAGCLTVARGAKALARLLFVLEWRWTPTDHWLEKELETLDDPAHAKPLLLQALLSTDPLLLRKAIEQLERTFPDEVPNRVERARLYGQIMHPDQQVKRSIHLLI
jgi:hypothetical protein